jgi:hypothetical protein
MGRISRRVIRSARDPKTTLRHWRDEELNKVTLKKQTRRGAGTRRACATQPAKVRACAPVSVSLPFPRPSLPFRTLGPVSSRPAALRKPISLSFRLTWEEFACSCPLSVYLLSLRDYLSMWEPKPLWGRGKNPFDRRFQRLQAARCPGELWEGCRGHVMRSHQSPRRPHSAAGLQTNYREAGRLRGPPPSPGSGARATPARVGGPGTGAGRGVE